MAARPGRAAIAAWVTVLAVLTLLGVLRALGDDEHGTAHRIGLAAGAVLVPVVLAAALWWVASRIVRRPRPVTSPWAALIALVIGALTLAAVDGDDAATAGTSDCRIGAAIFGAAPAGSRYGAVDARTRDEMTAQLRRLGFGEDDLEVRAVRITDGATGLMLAFANRGDPEGAVSGFAARQREGGADVRAIELGGRDAQLADHPDGAAIVANRGCAAIVVFGATADDARRFAEPVLR